MSGLIQVSGGRWGQGEGHPSALVQADVECWVSSLSGLGGAVRKERGRAWAGR